MQGTYVVTRFGELCTVVLGGTMVEQLPILDNLPALMRALDVRNATTIELDCEADSDYSEIVQFENEGI